jgi:hypothetical protein
MFLVYDPGKYSGLFHEGLVPSAAEQPPKLNDQLSSHFSSHLRKFFKFCVLRQKKKFFKPKTACTACNFIHLNLIYTTMAFEYRPLEVSLPGEKPSRPSSDSNSTLRAIDDLDYLSRDSELYYKASLRESASGWIRSKWLLAVHAVLLLTSCGMLVSTLILRSSTIYHVRQTSAWCK